LGHYVRTALLTRPQTSPQCDATKPSVGRFFQRYSYQRV